MTFEVGKCFANIKNTPNWFHFHKLLTESISSLLKCSSSFSTNFATFSDSDLHLWVDITWWSRIILVDNFKSQIGHSKKDVGVIFLFFSFLQILYLLCLLRALRWAKLTWQFLHCVRRNLGFLINEPGLYQKRVD